MGQLRKGVGLVLLNRLSFLAPKLGLAVGSFIVFNVGALKWKKSQGPVQRT